MNYLRLLLVLCAIGYSCGQASFDPSQLGEREKDELMYRMVRYYGKLPKRDADHDNKFEELGQHILPTDPLNFVDRKKYSQRLEETQKKNKMTDAARVGVGKINGIDLVVACMDFRFIGGSMGSVVGERLGIAIDHGLKHKIPVMIISQSGGARMMESVLSLMQMAKTSAKLAMLDKAGVPYISLMTDPTTGGVTASYAMLGDFNLAEPGALIGFAGPRVIRQTIGRDLPEGFQTAEYLLEHGFLDFIVPRTKLKRRLTRLLKLLQHKYAS